MDFFNKQAPNMPLTAKTMLAGGLAGLASVIGNTPVDVIKTQLQGLDADKYSGFIDCC